MGDIKQTNFRIDQETADAFRRFCEENGFNQAQGFDHVMQVVEMDRAKAAVPERVVEIESFEKSVKDIMAAYLSSIKIARDTEARIHEQYASDFNRRDRIVDDLREKADRLKEEKDAAAAAAGEAIAAKERAEKEAAAAEKIRAAAEKTAEDKKTIAETLAAKLSEAEKKAQGFDALKDRLTAAETALKEAEQAIKDVRREAAEAAKDAARAAEKEREEAVYKVREEASKEANTLREELRAARSEADNARREAETARTAAVAELTQAHLKDLSGLRSKLDERTEDLMRARQEISDLKIRLQEERQKNTAEKRDGANKDQK